MQVLRLFDPFGAVHTGVVHFPRVRSAHPRLQNSSAPTGPLASRIPRQDKRRIGNENKKHCFSFHFARLAHFGSAQDRRRLGNENKKRCFSFHFARLAHFGSAQDRRRLGNENKNAVFLFISLALHYLCSPTTVRAPRACPGMRDEKGKQVQILCSPAAVCPILSQALDIFLPLVRHGLTGKACLAGTSQKTCRLVVATRRLPRRSRGHLTEK